MSDSIARAQANMRQALKAGEAVTCPCCKQNVKAYRRKIDESIVLSLSYLIYLFQKHGRPVHYKDLEHPFGRWPVTITHWNTVRYWGLAEKVTQDHPWYGQVENMLRGDPDKPNTGYWVPTQAGIDFVFGRRSVQKYRHTYNGLALWGSGAMVTAQDCLGEEFNWAELQGLML